MYDQIWYTDVPGFITNTNYFVIIPSQDMSFEGKLNAILRFAVYLGVFLALVRNDYTYLFIGVVTALVTIVLNEYEDRATEKSQKFLKKRNLDIVDNKVCSRSTVDNPFMNPSISDISLNPNHPVACDIERSDVKRTVETNFNARLFRDVSDLYGKYASQRQFYTVPVTTIPGDQKGFGEWLYNRGPSCKEGNGNQCWQNIGELSMMRGGTLSGPNQTKAAAY